MFSSDDKGKARGNITLSGSISELSSVSSNSVFNPTRNVLSTYIIDKFYWIQNKNPLLLPFVI